jgi:polar amino acid transport system substrate-binding protein
VFEAEVNLKLFIFLLVLLVPTNAWAKCSKVLVWSNNVSVPTSNEEDDGELPGISADVVRLIMKTAGCEFTHKTSSWTRSLRDLELGNVDFISDASKTPERQKWGRFSEPYYIENVVLFYRKSDSRISSFTSLKAALDLGLRIGIGSDKYWVGAEFDKIKKSGKYSDQLVFVNNLSAGFNLFNLLEKGRIDLAISSRLGGSNFAKTLEVDVAVHDYVLTEDPWHLLFSKKSVNKSTLSTINNAIIDLERTGEMQRIINRYLM